MHLTLWLINLELSTWDTLDTFNKQIRPICLDLPFCNISICLFSLFISYSTVFHILSALTIHYNDMKLTHIHIHIYKLLFSFITRQHTGCLFSNKIQIRSSQRQELPSLRIDNALTSRKLKLWKKSRTWISQHCSCCLVISDPWEVLTWSITCILVRMWSIIESFLSGLSFWCDSGCSGSLWLNYHLLLVRLCSVLESVPEFIRWKYKLYKS